MSVTQVALGLPIVDGKLPLIKFKRNDLAGQYGIPGGKFDPGEFLTDAVERELQEELGHTFSFKEFLAVIHEDLVTETETKRIAMYACTVKPIGAESEVSTEPIDKPEGLIEWFRKDELEANRQTIVASDYRILHDIYLGGGRGYYKCILRKHAQGTELELFEPA